MEKQMEKQMKKSVNGPIKKIVYDSKYWQKYLSWTYQNI